MTVTAERGYLNLTDGYLTQSYMQGEIEDSQGLQVEMIVPQEVNTGTQVDMAVVELAKIGAQVEMIAANLEQLGVQADLKIVDTGDDEVLGLQVDMVLGGVLDTIGAQVKIFPLRHVICNGYLNNEPYLSDPYLTARLCAEQGVQVDQKIVDDDITGVQVDQKIVDDVDDPQIGMQVELRVDKLDPIGMQVNFLSAEDIGTQVTQVLYNISQLRILCDFVSRGTAALGGTNWTSPQGVETSPTDDFTLNNLNTDVLEQRTQSPSGVIALWELRCDTGIPQGAFADTLAILEHNLTRSATVTFQGSNDAGFGSIGLSVVLNTELENMYYIAPSLPTTSFRYYRFLIEDPTNTEGALKIGVIVFGSASIFSTRERFLNPVSFSKVHFKDSLATEGFTNVSNDRATRKRLGLSFQGLQIDGGNYGLLQDYFTEAKTDLKCLIIPLPTKPSVLAVFSKLVQLPDEQHTNNDEPDESADEHRISLELDWDESL